MAINILDASIYNHISAGEVVEKPASIVKELIENSIDAGATSIIVEIGNGGIEYINVMDNGCGIGKNDLEKVFYPHATSKIASITDLNCISTLGFRGEAMASVSAVSRVLLTSKHNDDNAYKVNSSAGITTEPIECIRNIGTTVEVKNLFYNTPVRARFLRKPKKEEAEITNLMSRYILSNPNIDFEYYIDEKLHFSHRDKTLFTAISAIYGAEISSHLIPIKYSTKDIEINGYISETSYSKSNTLYQTTIVNGRYVIDEIVSKAAYAAVEDFLMSRQFPIYIININMPFMNVDVNVHPNKMNIKYEDSNHIYNEVFTAIRKALLIPADKIEQSAPIEIVHHTELPTIDHSSGSSYRTVDTPVFDEVAVEAKEEDAFDFHQPAYEVEKGTQLELKEIANDEIYDYSDIKVIGCVFECYALIERAGNMIVIDYHAAQERLNYDKINASIASRSLAVQPLLIPYIHTVNSIELHFIESIKDELYDSGFDIDVFGNDKIIVRSTPVLLKDLDIKRFVDELLNETIAYKNKQPYQIHQYISQIACKSSVRSGDILSNYEVKTLVENIYKSKIALVCPHGRPFTYTVERSVFEKWFKRI